MEPPNFLVREDSPSDYLVIEEIWEENIYGIHGNAYTEVVFDIGANIGAFSALAQKIYPNATIYAFEPEPSNYELLEKNIEHLQLDRVIPIAKAIYSASTEVKITSQHGNSKISFDGTTVPAISLDEAMKDIDRCDVLKCDIEGSEYEIFPHASDETLSKVKYLTMEYHSSGVNDFGTMVSRLSEFFNLHFFGSHKTGGQLFGKAF